MYYTLNLRLARTCGLFLVRMHVRRVLVRLFPLGKSSTRVLTHRSLLKQVRQWSISCVLTQIPRRFATASSGRVPENTVPGDKESVPVRYVEKPFKTLHREVNEITTVLGISWEAFRHLCKNDAPEIKKLNQQTDKCDCGEDEKLNDVNVCAVRDLFGCCIFADGSFEHTDDTD